MRRLDSRLLRHGARARGYLAVAIGLGLAGTALILLQAGLLARALAVAGRGTSPRSLAVLLMSLALVLAGRAVAAGAGDAAALRAAAAVKSALRRQLSRHAVRLGPGWLSGQQAGEITTLATKGLDGLDAYVARYLPQLVLAVAVPAAVIIRVAAADWISAVIIGVTLPLIPVFAVLIGWHTKAQTQRQWRLLARLGGHFLDVVAGLPTLKVLGRATAEADVIRQVTTAHRRATMATLRVAFLSALVLELAAALATALVAVEVGLRLLTGHLGYETALLVLLLTPEAYLPLRGLGAQYHASTEGAAAAQRAFEILDTPLPARAAAIGAAPRPVDLRSAPITLRSLTLAYPGRSQPALDDVSLTIWPGQRIVLTGPSGAGKSSLLALLLRFAEPTSGAILAAGQDLSDIPREAWLSQIAWVPQQPHLFTASVAANISLGRADAAHSDIVSAARLAGADDLISSLPDGYDTLLSEGARSLSAGQRQKIALARAFLRRCPLLLLDEPTAHLDPASADHLASAISGPLADRTVIMVSHRAVPHGEAGWRALTLDRGRLSTAAVDHAPRRDAATVAS